MRKCMCPEPAICKINMSHICRFRFSVSVKTANFNFQFSSFSHLATFVAFTLRLLRKRMDANLCHCDSSSISKRNLSYHVLAKKRTYQNLNLSKPQLIKNATYQKRNLSKTRAFTPPGTRIGMQTCPAGTVSPLVSKPKSGRPKAIN